MSNNAVLTKIQGYGYHQFGKKVLATQIRFSTLEANFEVDEKVQRKLDPKKRVEIREFIIRSLEEGSDFYFSPFVFSARGAIRETEDGWELVSGSKLYITDGQHRAASLASAISQLNTRKEFAEELGNFAEAKKLHSYIEQLKNYPVAMQVYLDLNEQEEKQLFSDINSERREAHIGKVMLYDHRDEYTELTRKVAKQLEDSYEIEQNLSRISSQNSAITSLVTMRKCLLAMFEGILTVKKGAPYYRCNPDDAVEIAEAFFLAWKKIFPLQIGNRSKYVSGLTGIQISLAFSVYKLTKKYKFTYLEAIQELHHLKKGCTWRHTDPHFQYLYDPKTGKIKNHSSTRNVQKTAMAFVETIEYERQK